MTEMPLGKKEGVDRGDRETYDRARASECAACPLKPRCTTNKNGRQLRRYPGERRVDLVRSYRGKAPYEKALRKRKVWVEPLFAEAKDLAATGWSVFGPSTYLSLYFRSSQPLTWGWKRVLPEEVSRTVGWREPQTQGDRRRSGDPAVGQH
jgi:hypothetical protein